MMFSNLPKHKTQLANLFIFILAFGYVACSDKEEPSTVADKTIAKTTDTELLKIKLCTELPKISYGPPKPGEKQAGALKFLLWPPQQRNLSVKFLDGDPTLQQKIETIAKEWEQYCGITLDFHSSLPAQITITLKPGSCWSCIGTSSLKETPSMQLGWFDANTSEQELRRTVLHEFGHALGLVHEHNVDQNNPIVWDKEKVYTYYEALNGWDQETVDQNIFMKYEEESLNSNGFDAKSIMLYAVPKKLTTNGFSTSWNTAISENDKAFVKSIYPKKRKE